MSRWMRPSFHCLDALPEPYAPPVVGPLSSLVGRPQSSVGGAEQWHARVFQYLSLRILLLPCPPPIHGYFERRQGLTFPAPGYFRFRPSVPLDPVSSRAIPHR